MKKSDLYIQIYNRIAQIEKAIQALEHKQASFIEVKNELKMMLDFEESRKHKMKKAKNVNAA